MTPYFHPTRLRCGKCSHHWTGHLANSGSFDVALASIRATINAGCPHCGADGKTAVLMVRHAVPVPERAA